ncbi:Spectrin beta chain, brain 4 [Fukomys damarensis]|uniref:Spectrin beta chain, brain 4 n=1 Tax=Fukomys damarensis TaxID=885580 RepID=A0A091DRQ9_FUKDA|nr:Spectrin beta chain, brain 4 [Fukomys damarensis]
MDYSSLHPSQPLHNLTCAFHMAEQELGIAQLLAPEDVAALQPDGCSITTYHCNRGRQPRGDSPRLVLLQVQETEALQTQYRKWAADLLHWITEKNVDPQTQLQDVLLQLEALEPQRSEDIHGALQLTLQKVRVLESRIHYLQRAATKVAESGPLESQHLQEQAEVCLETSTLGNSVEEVGRLIHKHAVFLEVLTAQGEKDELDAQRDSINLAQTTRQQLLTSGHPQALAALDQELSSLQGAWQEHQVQLQQAMELQNLESEISSHEAMVQVVVGMGPKLVQTGHFAAHEPQGAGPEPMGGPQVTAAEGRERGLWEQLQLCQLEQEALLLDAWLNARLAIAESQEYGLDLQGVQVSLFRANLGQVTEQRELVFGDEQEATGTFLRAIAHKLHGFEQKAPELQGLMQEKTAQLEGELHGCNLSPVQPLQQ